jgi:hypothetical protein
VPAPDECSVRKVKKILPDLPFTKGGIRMLMSVDEVACIETSPFRKWDRGEFQELELSLNHACGFQLG